MMEESLTVTFREKSAINSSRAGRSSLCRPGSGQAEQLLGGCERKGKGARSFSLVNFLTGPFHRKAKNSMVVR